MISERHSPGFSSQEGTLLLTPCSYLQMCGMVFGSMIEADHRLRQYEAQVRLQRRIARDRAKWQQYEEEFSEPSSKSE